MNLSPWYLVCTKAMLLSKGSYGYGEPKNVICWLVQIPHRPVRARKLPMFRTLRIGPPTENDGNSGEPIAMVPCLHQGNVAIKRKLRIWRAQKCNLLVVQIPHRPVRARKLPMFRTLRIGPPTENDGNSGEPIAMVPCLHQGNVAIKRKLRIWRAQKCNLLVGANTAPTSTGRQNSLVSYIPYRAAN